MQEQLADSINKRRDANIVMIFLSIVTLYAGLEKHESSEMAIGSIIGTLMIPYLVIMLINLHSKINRSKINFITALIILVMSLFYVSKSYYYKHKCQQSIQSTNDVMKITEIYIDYLLTSPFSRFDYEEAKEDAGKIKIVFNQIKVVQQPNIEEMLVLEQKIDEIKSHESININLFFDQDKISQAQVKLDNWDNFMNKYLELNAKNEQIVQGYINNSDLSSTLKLNIINTLNKFSYNFAELLRNSFEIQKKVIVESRKIIAIATRNLTKAKITESGNLELFYPLDNQLLKTTMYNIEQYNQELIELNKKYNISPNLSD